MSKTNDRRSARTVDANSWLILDTSGARFSKRVRLVLLVVFLTSLSLVLRLAWVQLVASPTLATQAQLQRTSVITEPALRGGITDRNGQTLSLIHI